MENPVRETGKGSRGALPAKARPGVEDPITILVLDDEESIRWVIDKTLRGPSYRLRFAETAKEASAVMTRERVELALVDINLPGEDGLSFIAREAPRHPQALMAVITGEATMDHAVRAMKLGAFDYLTKPFGIDEIESLVQRAARTILKSRTALGTVSAPEPRAGTGELLAGVSRPMREIFKAVGRVADADLTVLVLGESGTGKELIARAIHHHSRRAAEPFVALNCAAIPRDLLEAELFGHEKGAFTGAGERKTGRLEAAGHGTVFLDEIGDLSLELQAKLLRVLQEREFQRVGGLETLKLNARIVAATNQSLEQFVAQGRFRSDLFYRINAFTLQAPPLRERREDIPVLARHLLARSAKSLGVALPALTPEAESLLEHYDWPGNVRELENVMKSLLITAHGPMIDGPDLPRNIVGAGVAEDLGERFEHAALRAWLPVIRAYCGQNQEGLLERITAHLERPVIRQVLMETGNNQVRAARVLGINRNTLRSRMQTLGISKSDPIEDPPPEKAGPGRKRGKGHHG